MILLLRDGKIIQWRDRRILNSKRAAKEAQSDSSSDTEESSEDTKKQKRQRTPAKMKTSNAKEKQGNSLKGYQQASLLHFLIMWMMLSIL